MVPPYKKLQPLISAFIKNSIFGNNRDPWLGLSVLERSQPSTPPPAVVLIPTYPSKVARSRAGCQMKLSHLVRVIADLHPPSLQMVMQQFLEKIADDGWPFSCNILELTCTWSSCFDSGEVVLPLQLQSLTSFHVCMSIVQLLKLARGGDKSPQAKPPSQDRICLRIKSRYSPSSSCCRSTASFLVAMIVLSGGCLLMHSTHPAFPCSEEGLSFDSLLWSDHKIVI